MHLLTYCLVALSIICFANANLAQFHHTDDNIEDRLLTIMKTHDSLDIRTFDINLDAHPLVRWDKVNIYFEEQIKVCHQAIMTYIPWYLKQLFWLISEIMESRISSNGVKELNSDTYLQYKGMAESLKLPTYEVML
jgi:hypothetical protein